MKTWLQRAAANPKTTVVGVLKLFGVLWYLNSNPHVLTPEAMMHPEGFVPAAVLLSAIGNILQADAKDEIRADQVKPDTTLVGEK